VLTALLIVFSIALVRSGISHSPLSLRCRALLPRYLPCLWPETGQNPPRL
jgi:hypothetical protein